jgi:hypothetical protein
MVRQGQQSSLLKDVSFFQPCSGQCLRARAAVLNLARNHLKSLLTSTLSTSDQIISDLHAGDLSQVMPILLVTSLSETSAPEPFDPGKK